MQTIKVLSENSSELHQIKVKADKGFNVVAYDLGVSEKVKKRLTKENTSIKIPKAENGKYYLSKGKYGIKIGAEKTNFAID